MNNGSGNNFGILLFIDLNETLVIPRLCNALGTQFACERSAAGRLRAACRALEVDRGRRGKKTPFVIALAALVLLTMVPAMVHPVARHIVFFKALRKPATSSVPWAMKTRGTVMTATRAWFSQDWRRGLKPPLSLTAAPSLERAECR